MLEAHTHSLYKPVGPLVATALLFALEGIEYVALLLGIVAVALACYATWKTWHLQKQTDNIAKAHAELLEHLKARADVVGGTLQNPSG